MKFRWKNEESYIVKPINLSPIEKNTTSNSWSLPIPPPRNWKLIGEKMPITVHELTEEQRHAVINFIPTKKVGMV